MDGLKWRNSRHGQWSGWFTHRPPSLSPSSAPSSSSILTGYCSIKSINFIILTLCSGSRVSEPAQSEAVQPVVLGDHLRLHGGHGCHLPSAPHHRWHLSWRVQVISLSQNHFTVKGLLLNSSFTIAPPINYQQDCSAYIFLLFGVAESVFWTTLEETQLLRKRLLSWNSFWSHCLASSSWLYGIFAQR